MLSSNLSLPQLDVYMLCLYVCYCIQYYVIVYQQQLYSASWFSYELVHISIYVIIYVATQDTVSYVLMNLGAKLQSGLFRVASCKQGCLERMCFLILFMFSSLLRVLSYVRYYVFISNTMSISGIQECPK